MRIPAQVIARVTRIRTGVAYLHDIVFHVHVLGHVRHGFRTNIRHLAVRDRFAVVADALLTRPAFTATEPAAVITAFAILAIGHAFCTSIRHTLLRRGTIRRIRIERIVIAWCTAFIVPAVLSDLASWFALAALPVVAHIAVSAVSAVSAATVITAFLAIAVRHAFYAFPLIAFLPLFAVTAKTVAPVGTAFLTRTIRHAFFAPSTIIPAHL